MPHETATGRFGDLLDRLEAGLVDLIGSEVDADAPGGALVHRHLIAARPAHHAGRVGLDDEVWDRLGADRLWSHQQRALEQVLAGNSVILSTGTASGKSLVAQAAIGQALTGPRPATALLLHPTKALGHDQLRHLDALGLPGVTVGAYDGDASDTERSWVRSHANVVFSNPDMLHVGILPRHGQWSTFLRRLRYVVVDEAHTLRGIFGGHVAHVLRRLRRMCAAYGGEPTFILASATVGEPAVLARSLTGLGSVEVVDQDGSPRGERLVVQINPPMLDPERGRRLSGHRVTATTAATLIAAGHRTIVFTRSRRVTETLTDAIRHRLDAPTAAKVQAYRAGFLATERRQIEADLASGSLCGVVATNALELGIDIGGLDACVVHGFPGTVSSFRQQIGRVGRGTDPSLAVLVAGTDQLDQYLANHPDELIVRPPEPVVVNPSNPNVLDPQLCCAASESPLVAADERFWGDDLADGIRRGVLADQLRIQRLDGPGPPEDRRAVYAGHGHPAGRIPLRSGSGREVRIVDPAGVLIGTVDAARATSTLYPGASYLHRTEPFRVVELDLAGDTATVEHDDGSTTTRADSTTEVEFLGTDDQKLVGRTAVSVGAVAVRTTVTGYTRIDVSTGAVVDRVALSLPPESLVTRAITYVVPARLAAVGRLGPERLAGALHALEHATIAMLPLFAICDRWDVGGLSMALHPDTGAPTIVIYDGYAGGAGIAELGFTAAEEHLATTLEMLASCPCAAGCPSCVQSPKCGNGNEPLDKAGAIELATGLLVRSTPVED